MPSDRWARIEQIFADALALPAPARHAFVARACAADASLRNDIDGLLRSHDASGVLDSAPCSPSAVAPSASLMVGACLGPWRVEKLIGRGGMGEVYLAIRADAVFEQRVALKLLRYEAAAEMQRFHAERRILARLEHPGIARLLDGGTAPDGRPYTVMEYVEGQSPADYCREHRSTLRERLALFEQVCDAVAFAHRHLIIHRDLKPDNILVNAEGSVKLLDFGIAKLLDAAAAVDTSNPTVAPFTPDYAAPEQLNGEPVTTATDVYALGVLLFELLTDAHPLPMRGLPSTHAIKLLLDRDAPAPSRIALRKPDAPVPARLLAGELDAIVAKCLRKQPMHRYETVSALKRDLQAHARNEPVLAREGARWYVFATLVRRYRWPVAATVLLIITLAAGLAGTIWQAQRANTQAARATATKDFLLGMFRANDPRIATDKPRAEITAKELLDLGSARIEKDFAAQPELQIELLGMTADIYENLDDDERYAALQRRRIELARTQYGATHPIVLNGLISEAEAAIYRQNDAKAGRLLDEVDAQINSSKQNRSVLRARWWLVKWELLHSAAASESAMNHAVDQSIALYRELAPSSNDYAYVLGLKAMNYGRSEDFAQARDYFERSFAVLEVAADRSDADLQALLNNYARNLEQLGDFAEAERTYVRAEELARKTFGERSPKFWLALAYHARLLHRHGERERAHFLFEQLLPSIPADWKSTNDDAWARGEYADCLVAEGRAREAIPILQATVRRYTERLQGSSLPVWRLDLSAAYDRAGRADEARAMLKPAVDAMLGAEQPEPSKKIMFRERWGRFLLDHSAPGDSDFVDAKTALRAVVTQSADRPSTELALAHSGLARVALAMHDTAAAVLESKLALATLARVQALYDVRLQPQIWLVHSSVLLKSGDAGQAREWAAKALEASQRYDDPSSVSIAAAQDALGLAAEAATKQ